MFEGQERNDLLEVARQFTSGKSLGAMMREVRRA